MQHEVFHYKTLDEVRKKMMEIGSELPLSENYSILNTTYIVHGKKVANRIAFQPMEGSDGTLDGAPGDLTFRRYERFAEGGPGIIWLEAVAVTRNGRASKKQLYLTKDNVGEFKKLVDTIKERGLKKNGFAPMLIMQASHSGRHSKPNGFPEPLIAYNNSLFEKDAPIDPNCILTDAQLDEISEAFGVSAKLAAEAGFDGVDIKACHHYLANELLSAYTRPGNYGGSYENRTRFLINAFDAAKAFSPSGYMLTSRLNVYDGFAYPYGFGVAQGSDLMPVLDEPIRLIRFLKDNYGMELINVTIGNPYVNPHMSRPYDHGNYIPNEHPLEGVVRLAYCASKIQKALPDVAVLCSGLSYLRSFSGNLATGMIEEGMTTFAGFGRLALAYPEFPKDLLSREELAPRKVCMTCGQCAKLLRAGENCGCVIRDKGTYSALSSNCGHETV